MANRHADLCVVHPTEGIDAGVELWSIGFYDENPLNQPRHDPVHFRCDRDPAVVLALAQQWLTGAALEEVWRVPD